MLTTYARLRLVRFLSHHIACLSQHKAAPIYALIFTGAAISAEVQVFYGGWSAFGAHFEVLNVARTLAARGELADPFSALPTGPTAHMPPLFPLFLAGLIRLFGDNPTFVLAAWCCCALTHALHAVLLVPLSDYLLDSSKPGIIAALISILLPALPVIPQYEVVYAATGSMLFCLGARKLMRSPEPPLLHILGLALAATLLLLLSATPVFVITFSVLLAFSKRTLPPAQTRRISLVLFTATLTMLSPWAIRNYLRLGHPVIVRSNFGLEVAVSNNDQADYRLLYNQQNGAFANQHPNISRTEAQRLRSYGEVSYNRARLREAVGWIRGHRLQFVKLTLRRIIDYWFPVRETIYGDVISFLTLLSIPGLVLAVRNGHAARVFIMPVLLLTPLPFYTVQTTVRYRAPILWLTLLLAGYLIVQLYERRCWILRRQHSGKEAVQNSGHPSISNNLFG